MSKEFGLDWQRYDLKRMAKFRIIMALEAEYQEEINNKNKKKQKQDKFRGRV